MSEWRSRGKRRLKSEINVVPYIDVMLVLLIIFMVAAPRMQPGVIDLPSVSQSGPANAPAIEVQILKDGALKLVDKDAGRSLEIAVDKASLAAKVAAQMRAQEVRPVVIAADKTVAYEAVLGVMDALRSGGIARVGLAVRPL